MDSNATVGEVMDREFVGVSESDEVGETAELMLEEGVDTVVVVRGSEPVGVMTERDALAALVRGDDDAPVTEAMTDVVPTVDPDETIAAAADEMSSQATKRLVVTNGEEPVGVISEHDLISTSPFAPQTGVGQEPGTPVVERPDDREQAGVTRDRTDAAVADDRAEAGAAADRTYEDQSICEGCGALARDLASFNGQLLCSDCRDI